LNLLLNTDVGGKLTIQLYDKQGDFEFVIVIFPYTCSNIPLSPVYGVYISQLIRFARVCSTYDQFLSRGRQLKDTLMLQGFLQSRLMSAFCKFYSHYNDLIQICKLSLSHMLSDIFYTNSQTVLGTLTLTDSGYLLIYDQGTGLMVGVTGRQGMLTPPRHLIPLR
jgi:hypothetical protein